MTTCEYRGSLPLSFSERGNKELQLADVLSPTSRKKTGRAYVALARAHSEKCVSFGSPGPMR